MQPIIPKRPTKKSSIESVELSDDNTDAFESPEKGISEFVSESIPVIPKRPKSKQPQSRSQVQSQNNDLNIQIDTNTETLKDLQLEKDIDREFELDPNDAGKESIASSNADLILPEAEKDTDKAKSFEQKDIEGKQLDEVESKDTSLPLIPPRPKAGSQFHNLNSSNSNEVEQDVDLTPGTSNRRSSFKGDENIEYQNQDDSGFGEDQETVQEKETEIDDSIDSKEEDISIGRKVLDGTQKLSTEIPEVNDLPDLKRSESIIVEDIITDMKDKEKSREVPVTELSNQDDSSSLKDPIVPPRSKKAPPKPKKLSSKIAAFQEMLNKQPRFSEEKDSKKQKDTEEENLVKGKLSSSHMQFAQNLQGIMGRGIALPGMVNNNILRKDISNQNAETSVEDSEIKLKDEPIRRTKGPKGKRLPKNLSIPATIELESKLEIYKDNLWVVKFEKVTKEPQTANITDNTTIIHSEESQGLIDENPEEIHYEEDLQLNGIEGTVFKETVPMEPEQVEICNESITTTTSSANRIENTDHESPPIINTILDHPLSRMSTLINSENVSDVSVEGGIDSPDNALVGIFKNENSERDPAVDQEVQGVEDDISSKEKD